MVTPSLATRTLARYRAAISGEPLPLAIVDLDALDANIARLVTPARARGKSLRLATKSIRCPELLRYIASRGAPTVRGLMTYTATETRWLADQGHTDLLLAYPTVLPHDVALLAETNARGATAAVVVDDVAHL